MGNARTPRTTIGATPTRAARPRGSSMPITRRSTPSCACGTSQGRSVHPSSANTAPPALTRPEVTTGATITSRRPTASHGVALHASSMPPCALSCHPTARGYRAQQHPRADAPGSGRGGTMGATTGGDGGAATVVRAVGCGGGAGVGVGGSVTAATGSAGGGGGARRSSARSSPASSRTMFAARIASVATRSAGSRCRVVARRITDPSGRVNSSATRPRPSPRRRSRGA